MRCRLLVLLVLCTAAGAGVAGGTPAPGVQERILFVSGNDLTRLRSVSPVGGTGQPVGRLSAIASPDWSPDGSQVAVVTSREGSLDVALMNADGSGVRPFAAGPQDEADPAWSSDGESIAYRIGNRLYIRGVDDGATRLVTVVGTEIHSPSWSPDGNRLAFAVDRADLTSQIWTVPAGGGRARPLTAGPVTDLDPAWSPGGRLIAFVRRETMDAPVARLYVMAADGTGPHPLLADTENHAAPAWSPNGSRIAFSRGVDAAAELYTIHLDGSGVRRLTENAAADGEPDWADVPTSRARLPDFDQRAPSGLVVTSTEGRSKLGFVSATDNVGLGPIWIRGARTGRNRTMEASQLVRYADGVRIVPQVGTMRYTISESHRHWHLLRFQSYELRRAADFRPVVTDRKSGFCLADHWGLARIKVPRRPAANFLGNCGQTHPGLRRVEHGTSIGYTDRYPAHFHGQNVDVTGVRAGSYWLVHRANADGRLRELDYENNDAAVLIRLTWPNGRRSPPAVDVRRICQGSERC